MDSQPADSAGRNSAKDAKGTARSIVLQSIFAAAVLAASGTVACGDELTAKTYVRGLTPPTEQNTGTLFTPDGSQVLSFGMRWRYYQAVPPYAFLREHPGLAGISVSSRNSQLLYTTAIDGITIHDPIDLSVRKKLTFNDTEEHRGGGYMTLSSDDKLLAFGTSRGLYALNAETMQSVVRYSHEKFAGQCAFLKFADDDKKLIAVWTREVEQYRVASKVIDVAQGTAEDFPFAMAMDSFGGGRRTGRGIAVVSPDQRALAFREERKEEAEHGLGNKSTLALVDARTSQLRWRIAVDFFARYLRFSPDGRRLLVNGKLHFEVGEPCAFRVLDVATGKLLLTMPADMPDITPAVSFAFAPDGKTLATCPNDPENHLAPIVLWDWAKIEAELLAKLEP